MTTSSDRGLFTAAGQLVGTWVALGVVESGALSVEGQSLPTSGNSRTYMSRRHVLAMGAGTALGALAGERIAASQFDGATASVLGAGTGGIVGFAASTEAMRRQQQRRIDSIIRRSTASALSWAEQNCRYTGRSVNAFNVGASLRERVPALVEAFNEALQGHPQRAEFDSSADVPTLDPYQNAAANASVVIEKVGRLELSATRGDL